MDFFDNKNMPFLSRDIPTNESEKSEYIESFKTFCGKAIEYFNGLDLRSFQESDMEPFNDYFKKIRNFLDTKAAKIEFLRMLSEEEMSYFVDLYTAIDSIQRILEAQFNPNITFARDKYQTIIEGFRETGDFANVVRCYQSQIQREREEGEQGLAGLFDKMFEAYQILIDTQVVYKNFDGAKKSFVSFENYLNEQPNSKEVSKIKGKFLDIAARVRVIELLRGKNEETPYFLDSRIVLSPEDIQMLHNDPRYQRLQAQWISNTYPEGLRENRKLTTFSLPQGKKNVQERNYWSSSAKARALLNESEKIKESDPIEAFKQALNASRFMNTYATKEAIIDSVREFADSAYEQCMKFEWLQSPGNRIPKALFDFYEKSGDVEKYIILYKAEYMTDTPNKMLTYSQGFRNLLSNVWYKFGAISDESFQSIVRVILVEEEQQPLEIQEKISLGKWESKSLNMPKGVLNTAREILENIIENSTIFTSLQKSLKAAKVMGLCEELAQKGEDDGLYDVARLITEAYFLMHNLNTYFFQVFIYNSEQYEKLITFTQAKIASILKKIPEEYRDSISKLYAERFEEGV